MTKVAVNRDYGGFHLPDEVAHRVAVDLPELIDENESRRAGMDVCRPCSDDLRVRSHPAVIEWAEDPDGERPIDWLTGKHDDSVKVVEVPDSVDLGNCVIFSYDGIEAVVEQGHFWPSEGLEL